MLARKPWFCISMADFTPAKCAPAEMPTPSSSLARRTRIICGSSSAMRIKCTSQVSGSADTSPMPHFLSASYTTRELACETGILEGNSLQGRTESVKSQDSFAWHPLRVLDAHAFRAAGWRPRAGDCHRREDTRHRQECLCHTRSLRRCGLDRILGHQLFDRRLQRQARRRRREVRGGLFALDTEP